MSACLLAKGLAQDRYDALEHFARDIGVAFQIKDDMLDIEGETDVIGKPAGSDEQANKSTYTTLMGVEQAVATAEALLEEALPMLERANVSDGQLAELGKLAVHRTYGVRD